MGACKRLLVSTNKRFYCDGRDSRDHEVTCPDGCNCFRDYFWTRNIDNQPSNPFSPPLGFNYKSRITKAMDNKYTLFSFEREWQMIELRMFHLRILFEFS